MCPLSSDTGRGYPPRLTYGGNAGLRSRYTAPWLAEPHVAMWHGIGCSRGWSQAASPRCTVGVAGAMDEIIFQQSVTPYVCTFGVSLTVFQQRGCGTRETCRCGCQARTAVHRLEPTRHNEHTRCPALTTTSRLSSPSVCPRSTVSSRLRDRCERGVMGD